MSNDFETFTRKEEVLALDNIIKGSGRDFRLVYVVSRWETGKKPCPVILLPAVVSRIIMMN